MRGYYTVDQVRDAEAPLLATLPDGVLMRRAAFGLARVVADELRVHTGSLTYRSVTLLVGSGDNGGDALWAGAYLRKRGVVVRAILLDPARAHKQGLDAFLRAGGRVATDLGEPDLVVDGIVGISGRGALRPDAAAVVAQVRCPIVAVDLPSGVDANTGAVCGPAVTAAVTVTFGALKPVHVLASPRCGRVELIDIGLDLGEPDFQSLEPSEVGALWPVPGPGDDKYSQGVVGVIAGSDRYPGAGVLCTGAAVTSTSGLVRFAGPGASEVLSRFPEVVASNTFEEAGRVQAWVVGPGMGTDAGAAALLELVLATDVPVVVDADGLTLLAQDPDLVRRRAAPTLLTPHAGEFARLAGREVGADRVSATRELASDLGVSVLLKGHTTVIADLDGRVLVSDAGGSWASTAGSGDVLSGVIGALLASGLTPLEAAAVGARAHALAANLAAAGGMADVAGAPISASPLLGRVRDAVRVLRSFARE
ncbi:NAD(P)H-hydrate dehydratase [Rhodococcus sp. IEGM 1379]|uniref:NAD(P)H-hydrate dehydratase n=1 Tax=Rhodococcus sp. IEGM 1379 TaxID=3047086 RepID=UPI0024B6B1C5|nr:NAD(P)H-hydrate dehydratase [Rhodococcus sp. IEGM 1379]MDI9918836.1 NAD(P)H-hydrate dehydratase [Rhodococcus sp. IEGM 1379]